MKLNKRFQLRLSSKTTSKATIRCFVSVNAEKEIPFSTNCRISPEQWSQEAQRIVGNLTDEEKAINETLSIIDADIRELFNELKAKRSPFNTRILVNTYTKKTSDEPNLLMLWDIYLDDLQKKVDNDKKGTICERTYKTYVRSKTQFFNFLSFIKLPQTIMPYEVDKQILSNYYAFICQKKNCNNEFINPYQAYRILKRMEKVFDFGIKKSFITSHPFTELDINIPTNADYKEIIFLTDDELMRLYNSELASPMEKSLCDGFIFMAYSGLTYCDFVAFCKNPDAYLKTDEDGYEYISKPRYKNRKLQNQPEQHIPLIKILKAILERYNYRIPVFANQTYNKSIKLIAHRVGIAHAEKITTYVGRKSAATFYINQDGVDIKTVAKILGHKHEITTRKHYAVTQDETVKRQIGRLEL
jgi:integrase/recombinase XerD